MSSSAGQASRAGMPQAGSTSAPQATERLTAKAGKYLTFKLGNEEHGLEILKVQEIIKMMDITRIPRTPDFIRGVINLRGKVIPVIDLRIKFELPVKETTEKTCIIVVEVAHDRRFVTMGVVVDEVSEVMDIAAGLIEPPPEFGTALDTAFILGLGKMEKKVLLLLNIDKILAESELSAVSRVVQK